MLDTILATKTGMTQAWLKNGRRVAVTKCVVKDNILVGEQVVQAIHKSGKGNTVEACRVWEVGYGTKKFKNVHKPLRTRLSTAKVTVGVKDVTGLRQYIADKSEAASREVGQTVGVAEVLAVGDVVKVQGQSKGHGFAGGVKRYGFKGGPATHGQSDRERAVGSVASGTTPGRLFRGKRLPGHYGDVTKTVGGLVVLYVNDKNGEVWLSGPIPGANTGMVKITKTGLSKTMELDLQSAGIVEEAAPAEATTEVAAAEAATETETAQDSK